MRLIHADFRKVEIPVRSIDLVATDPPYDRASLDLWDDLARMATGALKPTGCLVAFAPKSYLPEVLEILSSHLTYQGMISVVYHRPMRGWSRRDWISGWRPIVVYSRDPDWHPVRPPLKDTIHPPAFKKKWHKWEQGLPECVYLVERLTNKGDTILDPMTGGATWGMAAKLLGRNFIGIDIDQDAIDVAELRMTGTE